MAYVTVKGAGADKTVIEWDDTVDRVGSPFFIAKNLIFEGEAFTVGSERRSRYSHKAPLPALGALGKQAVALRISADAAAFARCRFVGSQDTLYDHVGRHYFRDLYVEGSADFVFRNGLSFYRGCHLHAVSDSYGAVTAQKRESLREETGFSFMGCKVTGSGALFLGRAWGTFSRVVFAHTYMDRIITPKGWYDWGDKNRDRTVFYGQYKCMGPGASFGGRVPWSRALAPEEAKPFVSLDFIDAHSWLSSALTKP